jgi:hypothetical protein
VKRLVLLLGSTLLLAATADASPSAATWEALPCTYACHVLYEDPCGAPPPEVFYADVVTPPAPEGPNGRAVVLEASIAPLGDWDLYACTPSGGGLGVGANILGDPCDNRLGPNNIVPVGCTETVSVPVSAGQVVVLRAVNIAGEPALTGTYRFATT